MGVRAGVFAFIVLVICHLSLVRNGGLALRGMAEACASYIWRSFRPRREAWGGLYTMVLDFIATCEQNITFYWAQGVAGAGVITVLEKMGPAEVFV